MPEAGYSGTPLLKKLGVKDGQRALLLGAPEEVAALADFRGWRTLKTAATARGIGAGPYDYAHVFTADRKAFEAMLPALRAALAPDGALWISWPKKSSGVPSTLDENLIRAAALGGGLVDVKVCAVSEVWSGLKLVIPVKDRPR